MPLIECDATPTAPILPEDILYDVRALCIFISAVFRESIPSFLVGKIPVHGQQIRKGLRLDKQYIRCIVKEWDEQYIRAIPNTETDGELLLIEYATDKQFTDMSYLYGILRKGMQLNLLESQIKTRHTAPHCRRTTS